MRALAGTFAAALLIFSSSAQAQVQAPSPDATQSGAPSPKRALPDYSGLGPEPTSAGDIALWPLRILLSPLYFTSEYLIRRPLGAIVTAAERGHVPEKRDRLEEAHFVSAQRRAHLCTKWRDVHGSALARS